MIVFLILNFENYLETVQCVESLLRLKLCNAEIVIVDNGSMNNSYDILKNQFRKYDFIHVIKTAANLGFANGNNFGYEYICRNFSPSCIVCLNSDIIIEQTDFIPVLNDINKNDHIALIGPDIVRPIGKEKWHQNPFSVDINRTEIERSIEIGNQEIINLQNSFRSRVLLYKNTFMDNIRVLIKRLTGIQGRSFLTDNKNSTSIQENVVLHGSCLIFTKLFLQNHHKLFCSETFLYGEEKILFMILRSEGYSTLYYPKLRVIHKHSQSTSKIEKSLVKRKIFLLEKSVESSRILLNILDNNRVVEL